MKAENNKKAAKARLNVKLYSPPLLVAGALGCQHINKSRSSELDVYIDVLDQFGNQVAGGLDTLPPGTSGALVFHLPIGVFACRWSYRGNKKDLNAVAISYALEGNPANPGAVPIVSVQATDSCEIT